MTTIQELTTQQIICGGLGIALILCIIFNYDPQIIIAIISGLIGFLTNSKVDQDKIQETIQTGLEENLQTTTTNNTEDTEEEPEETIVSSTDDDGVDTDGA